MKCTFCQHPKPNEDSYVCSECIGAIQENPDELLIETLQEQLQLVAKERDEAKELLRELADRTQAYVTHAHGFIMLAIPVMNAHPDLFPQRMWDAIKTPNDSRFNELMWKHQTPKSTGSDPYADRRIGND